MPQEFFLHGHYTLQVWRDYNNYHEMRLSRLHLALFRFFFLKLLYVGYLLELINCISDMPSDIVFTI